MQKKKIITLTEKLLFKFYIFKKKIQVVFFDAEQKTIGFRIWPKKH